jgi:hypothetical protein
MAVLYTAFYDAWHSTEKKFLTACPLDAHAKKQTKTSRQGNFANRSGRWQLLPLANIFSPGFFSRERWLDQILLGKICCSALLPLRAGP